MAPKQDLELLLPVGFLHLVRGLAQEREPVLGQVLALALALVVLLPGLREWPLLVLPNLPRVWVPRLAFPP